MWKSLASNGLTLFLIALVALGGIIGWGQREFRGEGPLEAAICLRIEPGNTINVVSARLEEAGAISDPRIFRIGADYTDKSSKLKFGSYLVPERASMEEILELVTVGGQSTCGVEVLYTIGVNSRSFEVREMNPETEEFVELAKFDPTVGGAAPSVYADVRAQRDTRYSIKVVEGVTSWQVVDALGQADFLEGEVGAVPDEGSLAPDTYEVRAGSARADFLDAMKERQAELLQEIWETRADGLPFETLEEALVLASIIEKETSVPEERRRVASVFINRLRQGMRLQTDPTVIYGITEGVGTLGRGLRQSELRRATPYNTYVIDGLPPGPIANPGRASLEAAVNPEESDYLFFVADGSGGHAFALTLDEHNRNVRAWREIERQRSNQ